MQDFKRYSAIPKILVQRQIQLLAWQAPPLGFVKVNVDATARTNPGDLSIGVLIRDSEGRWLFGFARRFGWGNITRAEIYAIYYGLLFAWERNFRRVIIESDSLHAVTKINGDLNSSDLLFQVIYACKELLSRGWDCKLVHTYRETNMCADFLASWAFQGNFDITQLNDPPDGLCQILEKDMIGVARPRAVLVG